MLIQGAFGSLLLFEYLNILIMKNIDANVYVVRNAFANRANPLDASASDEPLTIPKTKLGNKSKKPAITNTRCLGVSFTFFTSYIFTNKFSGEIELFIRRWG